MAKKQEKQQTLRLQNRRRDNDTSEVTALIMIVIGVIFIVNFRQDISNSGKVDNGYHWLQDLLGFRIEKEAEFTRDSATQELH